MYQPAMPPIAGRKLGASIKQLIVLMVAVAWCASPVQAGVSVQQTPIPLLYNAGYERSYVQNSRGWAVWLDQQQDVYLYRGSGDPIRLTATSWPEGAVQINDKGWVVWHSCNLPASEIYLYKGTGQPIRLTNDRNADSHPLLNNNGWVAWWSYNLQAGKYIAYLYKGSGAPIELGRYDTYSDYQLNDNNEYILYNNDFIKRSIDGGPLEHIVSAPKDNYIANVYLTMNGIYWLTRHKQTLNAQLYYYNGRSPVLLSGDYQEVYNVAVAPNGLAAWSGRVLAANRRISYYDGSQVAFITAPSLDYYDNLRINQKGWIVWQGYIDHAIYLYRGSGEPAQISSPSSQPARAPRLNDNGWIVWQVGDPSKGKTDLYVYYNGAISPLASDAAIEYYYQVNADNSINWVTFDKAAGTAAIYRAKAKLYAPYQYKFTFGNGDYYTGTVYAAATYGYYPGKTWTTTDENKQVGQYAILACGAASDQYAAKLGQVLTDATYYDAETKASYKIAKPSVGYSYLGKETGYILRAGVPYYQFGKGYYEADVGDRYTYKYVYGNGDYYSGYLYVAPHDARYFVGQTTTKKNALGISGYYEITGISYTGVAPSEYGKTWITHYYDGSSSKKMIKPLFYTSPLGSQYLGSEIGYIINDEYPQYRIGKGYYEADL